MPQVRKEHRSVGWEKDLPLWRSIGSQRRKFWSPPPEKDLDLSFEHSRKSDLFVVVGSSLVVTPAADMPREALCSGAKLVILNEGKTPFDSDAHLRFNEKIGEVLPRMVKRLKTLMGVR